MNLLETYSKRLKISEGVYAREHNRQSLTNQQKITIARVLANTSAYLNEAFSQSSGTQRSDMGNFKKFCLDLTTVALPNLIANELVIVKPMASITGYIQYLRFVAGSNKGGITQGTLFNDPFRLGQMNDARIDYTGSAVVETVAADATVITPAWTPVVGNKVIGIKADNTEVELTLVDGSVTVVAGVYTKVKYVYDNVYIPQNDIPTLNANMDAIALEAKPRRIAIYYSQMAAFQAKTETGTDLGAILAEQACAELSYEIDTEIVKLLDDNAGVATADLTFNKTLPVGVSKAEHYEGFAEIVEKASQVIYDKTQKHSANYMVIASNIKPILSLMRGWKASNTSKINGPYFAGTLNGIKVFVSPAITAGRFFLGFNGGDLITSAAIFAPYMAVVPTQLLNYADGGYSQGFSTLYDAKILNPDLLVAGKVVEQPQIVEVHTNA